MGAVVAQRTDVEVTNDEMKLKNDQLSTSNEEKDEEIRRLSKERETVGVLNQQISNVEAEKDEQIRGLQEVNREKEALHRTEKAELEHKLEEEKRELLERETYLKHNKEEFQNLQDKYKFEITKEGTLQKSLDEQASKVKDLDERVKKVKEEREAKEEELKRKTKEMYEAKANLKVQLEGLEVEKTGLKNQIDKKNVALQTLHVQEETELKKVKEAMRKQEEDFQQRLNQKTEELRKEREVKMREHAQEVEKKDTKIQEQEDKNSAVEVKYQELRTQDLETVRMCHEDRDRSLNEKKALNADLEKEKSI